MTDSKVYHTYLDYPPTPYADVSRMIPMYSPMRPLLMSPPQSPLNYQSYFGPMSPISPFFSSKPAYYNRGSALTTPISHKNEMPPRLIDFDKSPFNFENQLDNQVPNNFPFEHFYPEIEQRHGEYLRIAPGDTRGNIFFTKAQDDINKILFERPDSILPNNILDLAIKLETDALPPQREMITSHEVSQRKAKKVNSAQADPQRKLSEKIRQCNCKKTKCLKLYCECFSFGEVCGPNCNCASCDNKEERSQMRVLAMEVILNRDPLAFSGKIKGDSSNNTTSHIKGCNCKKSNCLKKYCECFNAGIRCGDSCKCDECKNLCHDPSQKGPDSEKTLPISPREQFDSFTKASQELENSNTLRTEERLQKSTKKSTPNRIKLYRGGGGHNQRKNSDPKRDEEAHSSDEGGHSPALVKKVKRKAVESNIADIELTEHKLKQQSSIIKEFEGKMTPYSRTDARKNLLDDFKTPVNKQGNAPPARVTRSAKEKMSRTTRKRR